MRQATLRTFQYFAILLLALTLAACGGGDDGSGAIPMPEPEIERPAPVPEPEPAPEPEPRPEPEPVPESKPGPEPEPEAAIPLHKPDVLPPLPRLSLSDAVQAPISNLGETLRIGADVAPPANSVPGKIMHDDIAISFGELQDGVATWRLLKYLHNHVQDVTSSVGGTTFTFQRGSVGLGTFLAQPIVRLAEGTSAEHVHETVRAVQAINAWLPCDKRIVLSDSPAPPLTPIGQIPDGQIFVDFAASEQEWDQAGVHGYRHGAAATAEHQHYSSYNHNAHRWEDTGKRAAHVWFNTGAAEFHARFVFEIMVHELLHALGLFAHVPHEGFSDSIMRASYLPVIEQLPGIDGEAVLAIYTRFRPGMLPKELETDALDSWEDTSFHLRGDVETVGGETAFGVAFRNGLAQSWAFGPAPWTLPAGNPVFSETVTWKGRLLGLTPATESVAGNARLDVVLATLSGDLDFSSLESWNANGAPGVVGTGEQWGDGTLSYDVRIMDNTFIQTGGDAGIVTGAFFGPQHEAMGGTLERDDLTAAFGGKR